MLRAKRETRWGVRRRWAMTLDFINPILSFAFLAVVALVADIVLTHRGAERTQKAGDVPALVRRVSSTR